MLRWRLSITADTARFHMARRLFARQGPLLAAIAALGVTLALGRTGPALALFAGVPIEWAMLAPIAGAGLLAWHLARLTILPLAESPGAALTAALIPPLLMPGLGLGGLIPPLILSLWVASRHRDQRVVALMVHCGALAGAAGSAGSLLVINVVYATMLGFALFLALRALSGAANDNPSMERIGSSSRLPDFAHYARSESIPGKWGVSNV
jgi:hypothetical protein